MVDAPKSAHWAWQLMLGAARRAWHGGLMNPVAYATTRFWTVRQILRVVKQRFPKAAIPANDATLFSDANPAELAPQLRQQGFVEGLTLPAAVVESILQFGRNAECTTYTGYGTSGTPVRYRAGDWREAEGRLGRAIPLGRIRDPARTCPDIRALECDPMFIDLFARYLGYLPSHVESRLYWSFAREDLPALTRASLGQNVLFHYDLHGAHGDVVFVQFYLTDVGPDDGPLELIPRSHSAKPLRMLLGSANHSDDRIARVYGRNGTRSLKGPAGTGFVMDGYCIHRATPPIRKDRLFLQIRFA